MKYALFLPHENWHVIIARDVTRKNAVSSIATNILHSFHEVLLENGMKKQLEVTNAKQVQLRPN
jgi:hypothetical protein